MAIPFFQVVIYQRHGHGKYDLIKSGNKTSYNVNEMSLKHNNEVKIMDGFIIQDIFKQYNSSK